MQNATSAIKMLPKPYQTIPRQQNIETNTKFSQSQGHSQSQKTLIRPKTAGMLPPRDNRRFQIKGRNDATPMAAQPHQQVDTLLVPTIASGVASQEEQSASSPQFKILTAPKIRRPVSAILNKNGTNEVVQSALPSLLPVASLNPMVAGIGGTSPVVLRKPVRGASAITRDARSVSSIFQDTVKSSTWTKTRKRKKGTGNKVSKKSNAGQTALLNKKFARNHKYVVQQIDNFTRQKEERIPSPTSQQMPQVAPEVEPVPQHQPLEDPSRYPMLATGINGELQYLKQESPQVAQQIEPGTALGSGRDQQQLVYMVHNYYGGWNNHNYTPASAQANQQQQQQDQQQQWNQQQQQLQPIILAQNQEPQEDMQRLDDDAGDLREPQELQQRKRQLMTRRMPKKPRKHPVLIKVPIADEEGGEDKFYDQHRRLEESDSDRDWTLLNRSYSVDTSHYLRHLHRKGKNFDVMRGLSKSLDRDGSPSPHLSKLERQMYVMKFLENAQTRNPFRSLKIKGLIDKHGRAAKKELRQMLQQEEDWASLTVAAYSDEDVGYARQHKKRSRDRYDHGNFYVKDDLNQYQKRIQQNDHYKKLQQLKATQHQGAEQSKAKSKSPSHFSSTSPIPPQSSKAAFGVAKCQHPLAQSQKNGKNVVQLQIKQYRSEKELVLGGGRTSQSRHRAQKPRLLAKKFIEVTPSDSKPQIRSRSKSRSKQSNRNRQALRNFQDVDLDSPSSPYKKKSLKKLDRHAIAKLNADQNGNQKFRIEENSLQHRGRVGSDDFDRSQNGSSAITNETQPYVIEQDPQQQLASIDRNIDQYKQIIHQLKQNQLHIRRCEGVGFEVEDIEQSLSQPSEHHEHNLQLENGDENSNFTQTESPSQHMRGQHRHQSDQLIAIDTLRTIQSNHQNEEMQTSSRGDGLDGRDQALTSSLMTDTGIVSDFMSASQAANTPKSIYQHVQTPTKGLATIKERSDDAKFECTAQGGQRRQLGQQASASSPVSSAAFANAVSPMTFNAVTAPPTDITDSEFQKIIRFREPSNPQQDIGPSPSRHGMFDIGEPSQTSEKVIAMLDLNMDPFLNIYSQHSSSMAGAHTNRIVNSGTTPQRINQPQQNTNNSTVMRDCKAGSNGKTLQQEQQKQPQHNDSCKSLSGSRPPLLKMRTQIFKRKERSKHTLSKHDMIEGSKGNGSVNGGGHFFSEQQNSIYQKAESEAKVTSKGQTWQAISVHQILAGSAAQNESTQVLQQQMGSVLSAANYGNGNLPSVEELHNDASPTQQVVSDNGGFKAKVQQLVEEKMLIKEEDVDPSRNVEKLSCTITDSFVEDTIEDTITSLDKETDKQPAATHTDRSLGIALSPLSHDQDDGLLKPNASGNDTNSPDTSQRQLLSMIDEVQNRLTDQKRKRDIDQNNEEDVDQKDVEEKVEVKPKIVFQPELTEAGTQTLKNMGAQTESESPKHEEFKQEKEMIPSQREDPRLPLHTVKEENSIITDSPLDYKTPTHERTSTLRRQGTTSSKAEEQVEVNRLVCEAAETTRLAQKLLEQQSQQMVLYQKQQNQLQEQSNQQNQIQQQQFEKQQELTSRRERSIEPIVNAQQQQVIVCSPFEQDMFEMLAIAAVMPKAQIHYTEVDVDEADLIPIPRVLRQDDENVVNKQMIFEYEENKADDAIQAVDHRLDETPIEMILKGLHPQKPVEPSQAYETSVIVSERLSTPRTRSHNVTINIDGVKFYPKDVLIMFQPVVSDEDDSIAIQSEQLDRQNIIELTEEDKLDSESKFFHESAESESCKSVQVSELTDVGGKSNFSKYVIDLEKDVPKKMGQKRKEAKSSNSLPSYVQNKKSNFARIKSFELSCPTTLKKIESQQSIGQPVKNGKESSATMPQNLKRHATQLQSTHSASTHGGRVKEDFANTKLKILSRFVDSLVIEKAKSEVDEENLEEILEMSYEQNSSRGSYMAIEMDSFGFEIFTCSIVNHKKVHEHEHKILYSNNWGIRLRQQQDLSINFTKMATILPQTNKNNLKNSLTNKSALMQQTSDLSDDSLSQLASPLTNNKLADNENKSSVFENKMRMMQAFATGNQQSATSNKCSAMGRTDSIRSLKIYNSVNNIMAQLQSHSQLNEYKSAVQYNIVDWLAAEYPIVLQQGEEEPSSINQKKLILQIPNAIIVQAQNIDDIKKMEIFDNQTMQPNSKQESTSRSSTQRHMLSQFRRVSNKKKQGMTNKWLLASIYFNDLAYQAKQQDFNDSIRDGHSHDAATSPLFPKWHMVDNANFDAIQYDLDQRAAAFTDPKTSLKEPAGEKITYRVMLRNKHYRSAQLSRDGIFTKLAEIKAVPLYCVRLSTRHFALMVDLIQQSGYIGYSQHAWCVSQENKQHYANQGERAQRFFQGAIKHSQVGTQHIYNETKASMRAFMRRSTVRQEIQDILFVRNSMLLLDEEYVSRENLPRLVQTIRLTILKSCEADQQYNAYLQHTQKMLELEDIVKKDRETQNDRGMFKLKQKASGHTQFSKSLIFINFHPKGEGKRWIHEDYMNKLMQCDQETPRYYGDYLKQQLDCQTRKLKLRGHISNTEMPEQMLFSIKDPKIAKKNKIDSAHSDSTLDDYEKDKQDRFPFILNDQFGYLTLMLTDGCYQILVPSRPECRDRKRKLGSSLSTRSGLSVQISISPLDETMQNSLLYLEGESSPMTPATSVTFMETKNRQKNQNEGFSTLLKRTDMNITPLQLLGSSQHIRQNTLDTFGRQRDGKGSPPLDKLSNYNLNSPQAPDKVAQPSIFKRTTERRKSLNISIICEQQNQIKKAKTQVDEMSDDSSSAQFSFSISEEDKYEKKPKISGINKQKMASKNSKFLQEPFSSVKKDQFSKNGLTRFGAMMKSSGSTSRKSDRSHSEQSIASSQFQVMAHFQKQQTKSVIKLKKMQQSKLDDLKIIKAKSGNKKVGNIRRETISSIDQLKDTRIPAVMHKKLLEQGIKPLTRNSKNGSERSPDIRSMRGSPQKQLKGRQSNKQITIVKQWDLQSTIDAILESSVNKKQENFKHAIKLQETEVTKRNPSKLSQTLLVLRLISKSLPGQAPFDRLSTEEDQVNLVNSQSQIQVLKRMQAGVNKQVEQMGSRTFQRTFFKYQVSKHKESVSLLTLKTPRARIREKKEYEQQIEAIERNKVFSAIEFSQIQVIEDYIKCHMLGVDVTDKNGNTLLSMAAQFGCWDICNLLLKEGANVDSQNKIGNTPLHYAIAYKRSDIVDLLIESGAKETIKNKSRLTAWQGV